MSENRPPNQFATTHWSVVLAAGKHTPDANAALIRLCESYWYPLYAYVRRRGHQPTDAQDLIQAFFCKLLDSDWLESADPERGRFRSFLLTVLNRFIAKQRRRENSHRQGGGRSLLSLDLAEGEARYQCEPADTWTAEKLFDRRWALTLLDRVLEQLEAEYCERSKKDLFEALRPYLTAGDPGAVYAEIAERLEMTPDAIKVAVYRLRKRYRALLQAEISHTVSSKDAVESELGELLRALRGA